MVRNPLYEPENGRPEINLYEFRFGSGANQVTVFISQHLYWPSRYIDQGFIAENCELATTSIKEMGRHLEAYVRSGFKISQGDTSLAKLGKPQLDAVAAAQKSGAPTNILYVKLASWIDLPSALFLGEAHALSPQDVRSLEGMLGTKIDDISETARLEANKTQPTYVVAWSKDQALGATR
jgi:hypothetical protein